MNNFFVGTSHIMLPCKKSEFPEPFKKSTRLCYYSSLLNSIEINSSHYKIPRVVTLNKWCGEVPDDFVFTLKIFNEISHVKQLAFDPNTIDDFMVAANGMEQKKGCLLLQFPGKISLEYFNEVERIISHMHDQTGDWKIAVEFRHQSWQSGETDEMLNTFNATVVKHDKAKSQYMEWNRRAPFYYFRYHGPLGDYRGSYSDDQMRAEALIIRECMSSGKQVFAYFNNTMGNAFENARTLQQLVLGNKAW